MTHTVLPLKYSGLKKEIDNVKDLEKRLNSYIGIIVTGEEEKQVTFIMNINAFEIDDIENIHLNSVNYSLNFKEEEYKDFLEKIRQILINKTNIIYSLNLEEMATVNISRNKKDPRKINFFFNIDKGIFSDVETDKIIGMEEEGSQNYAIYETSFFELYNFYDMIIYYMVEDSENF